MIVLFDIEEFRGFYPNLAQVTDGELSGMFRQAEAFVDNTESSRFPFDPDKNVFVRKEVLYLFVCHLATMSLWKPGQSGPLSSASQGSVSVGYQVPAFAGGLAWFNQTPCGRTLAQLVKPYMMGGKLFAVNNFHPYG